MKYLELLVWFPQFGISAAVPLAGAIAAAVWLRNRFGLGNWILVIGILAGLFTAFVGARDTLKAMSLASNKKAEESETVCFNEHT